MMRGIKLVGAIVLGAVLAFGAHPAFAQASKSDKAATKVPAQPVDINTASQADLEALPGVGPATAKKIIAGRPYSSVQDLSKAGVSKKTLDKIGPMVTAGAAPAPSTPAAPAPSASKSSASSTATPKSATASSGTSKTAQMEARVPPAKGMVWVNTKSGVYHSEGDQWYGKTKEGKFMTEPDAIKAGYHASKEGAAAKKQ